MEAPGDQARFNSADEEPHNDEEVEGRRDWAGIPVKYSLFHPGYTTKHWLMVLRPF